MEYLKKTGKSLLYTIISFLVCALLITTLSYFNITYGYGITISKIFSLVLAILIGSFEFGKTSSKKGWLEGIKFGIICTSILIIISFLISKHLNNKNILYYLIIIITSSLGSMLGINMKKKD